MPSLSTFRQQFQQQTNWCWAAVAVSAAEFFRRGEWLQCTFVQRATNGTSCCASPSSCNITFSVESALSLAQCFAGRRPGVADLDTIRRQIDHGKPVVIRLEDRDRIAHVMTIVGYGPEAGDACRLTILDPWTGPNTVAFGALRSALNGWNWSDTYFTG